MGFFRAPSGFWNDSQCRNRRIHAYSAQPLMIILHLLGALPHSIMQHLDFKVTNQGFRHAGNRIIPPPVRGHKMVDAHLILRQRFPVQIAVKYESKTRNLSGAVKAGDSITIGGSQGNITLRHRAGNPEKKTEENNDEKIKVTL